LSPTLLVFVQTSPDEASASVVPEGIVPVRAAAGAGVVFVGVGVVLVVVGDLVVFDDPVLVTTGALVVPPFAVSLSVRFALSLFASAMFAASAESFFRAAESVLDESLLHPASAIATTPRDAAVIRV
jgi:hypothetical protein